MRFPLILRRGMDMRSLGRTTPKRRVVAPPNLAVLDPSMYSVLVRQETPRTLTGSSVGAIQTEGKGKYVWPLSSGTTAQPQQAADGGVSYSAGRYHNLGSSSIPNGIPAEDGIILAVDFTPMGLATGTQTLMSATHIIVRSSGLGAQLWYSSTLGGASKNIYMGPLTNGVRTTLAVYLNRVAGTVSWLDLTTGQIVSESVTFGGPIPNVTTLLSGSSFIGTIHRRAAVFQGAGEPLPQPFTKVVTDFRTSATTGTEPPAPQPESPAPSTPLASVQSHPYTGQSLELGVNAAAAVSPSGVRWRDVLSSPRLRMVTGRKRADGVSVSHVAAPVLAGYDATTPGTGDAPAYLATYIPLGTITDFHSLSTLPDSTGIVTQFPGAGGMSILDLTTGPCFDNFAFNIMDEHRYWSGKGVEYSVPSISINQGEADVSRVRGWWDTNAQLWLNKSIDHIRQVLGDQNATPRLYVQQTGGYMFKNDEHEVVLDQIEFVRRNGGVLVGANYWEMIDNTDGRGVHQTLEAELRCGIRRSIARAETNAGRAWSLLPPVSVQRVGNMVTIPITTRSNETLVTVPNKYAGFGGDPPNLGLEVLGGGTITSANVSGSDIVLEVAGAVTAVRYAKQRTGIDYRTQCDAQGRGYATHRGIIKATDQWAVTVGGLALVIDRPVPSFEVAVMA